MIGIIYKYTSPADKVYIGQTTQEKRRRKTFLNLNKSYGGDKIDAARAKYGPETFNYEVLYSSYFKTKEEATMSNNNHNSILQVIETIYALQTDMTSDRTTTSVCPRCGQAAMAENPVRNALSRHATVYICDACGTDEAIRDWNKNVLPLESWACAKHAECHVFKTLNPAD